MIKVGIVGASGYGGGELLRWLATHPEAKVVAATSKTYAGKPVGSAFAGQQHSELVLADDDLACLDGCEVVFLAGNDEASMCLAEPLLESGHKIIDLTSAFRFVNPETYTQWYKEPHKAPLVNRKAVYGLPELNRANIASASLIGNPGCFVTAAVLGLAPAVKAGLLDLGSIIVDGISGVSGAGRSKFGLDYHFAEMNENAWAYKIAGAHRHTGEMEEELSKVAGQEVVLSFTPHVVPMTRGILATCYGNLAKLTTLGELEHIYKSAYGDEPFIQLVEGLPATKHTMGSNRCHISFAIDDRTNRLVVVSALDNLGKGMAGQAIQNMNLMFGLPETTGLLGVALWP